MTLRYALEKKLFPSDSRKNESRDHQCRSSQYMRVVNNCNGRRLGSHVINHGFKRIKQAAMRKGMVCA